MYTFVSTLTHPWWQHGEVEENSTVPLVVRQFIQLGDGFQGGEGLIDRDSQSGWAIDQLLFNIVCLTITWVGEGGGKNGKGGDR